MKMVHFLIVSYLEEQLDKHGVGIIHYRDYYHEKNTFVLSEFTNWNIVL